MPATLTQKAVEAAKPHAQRVELPDALVPGLRLVVQPTGAKSWAVRYRHGGASRKLVLGPLAPVLGGAEPPPVLGAPLSLRGARAVAREQLQVLATGVDPAAAKQAAKKAAANPENQDADLVRTLVSEFLRKYLKPRAKPSYFTATERTLTKEVLPAWGDRRIRDIRRRDVLALLDEVVERGAPVQANRVLAALRKLFNWAVSRDLLDDSPARGVKPPTREVKRDRVLLDGELRLAWLAAGQMGYPFGHMVRMLILTGARREEVAGMRRSEVDAEGTWKVPGGRDGRTKNKEPLVLPLPDQALAIVASVPAIAAGKDEPDIPAHRGVRDLMFSTTGRTPVSGFDRAKDRLHAGMLAIARREAKERGEDPDHVTIADFRFHDLRRSFATGLTRLGFSGELADRLINHRIAGVAGVYLRHDHFEEKRVALAAWADHVETIASGKISNVKPTGHRE